MSNLSKSIDDYWEYHKLVGDDDGGKTFTPEEFERYKREVIPRRLQNRLFVSWTNSSGMDCKLVGPETPCFCAHRYRQHKTDFKEIPTERPIMLPCRQPGCPCRSYLFVPANVRCRCKHLSEDHKATRNLPCAKNGCNCVGFSSGYTCACMEPFDKHRTIVETKNERSDRGLPVGQNVPYQAMGGITGFSSMLDGYARLDDSGKGRLTTAELEAPISATDHPFLRAHQQALEGRNAAGPSRLHESLNISRPHRIHRAPEGQTSRTRSKSEVTHRRNEKK